MFFRNVSLMRQKKSVLIFPDAIRVLETLKRSSNIPFPIFRTNSSRHAHLRSKSSKLFKALLFWLEEADCRKPTISISGRDVAPLLIKQRYRHAPFFPFTESQVLQNVSLAFSSFLWDFASLKISEQPIFRNGCFSLTLWKKLEPWFSFHLNYILSSRWYKKKAPSVSTNEDQKSKNFLSRNNDCFAHRGIRFLSGHRKCCSKSIQNLPQPFLSKLVFRLCGEPSGAKQSKELPFFGDYYLFWKTITLTSQFLNFRKTTASVLQFTIGFFWKINEMERSIN